MSTESLICYNRLWKLMVDKNINKTQLKDIAHISTNAVAKMSRNEKVSLETLAKICYALDCESGDIIEIVIEERRK